MKKKAYYRKIPCYYNSNTDALVGRNWFFDILVGFFTWFDFAILDKDEIDIWVEVNEIEKQR